VALLPAAREKGEQEEGEEGRRDQKKGGKETKRKRKRVLKRTFSARWKTVDEVIQSSTFEMHGNGPESSLLRTR
jgi:hypothetical protein